MQFISCDLSSRGIFDAYAGAATEAKYVLCLRLSGASKKAIRLNLTERMMEIGSLIDRKDVISPEGG